MNTVLLYVSSFIILLGFILYLVLIFINKKEISKVPGLDIITEILNDFSGINVLLSKSKFSYYDIKRKVVKLNSNSYYGNNLDDISIGLIEAGILVNHKRGNKIIEFFSKFIPTLKLLYILPIIAILINFLTYNSFDAFVSLIFLLAFAVVAYILIDIKTWVLNFYSKKSSLNKKIVEFIKYVLYLDWIILIGELVMIFRFIFILLNINI